MGTPSFFLIILPSLVFPYFESRVDSSHDTFSRLPGVISLVSAVWCQQPDVSSLVPTAWCQRAGVSSLVTTVWCQQSGVSGLVSAVWCQRSGASSLVSAICCYFRHHNSCAIFTVAEYVELNLLPKTCSTILTIEASRKPVVITHRPGHWVLATGQQPPANSHPSSTPSPASS